MKLESKLTEKDAEKISGLLAEVAAAWEAIPDPDDRDYDTLASAVRALVKQRDQAWSEIRALNAARANDRISDQANVAHREGYEEALFDVSVEMEGSMGDAPRDRWQYLWGWVTGRRAGL